MTSNNKIYIFFTFTLQLTQNYANHRRAKSKKSFNTHHVKFVVRLSSTDVSSDVCGINPNGCCVPANSSIEINNNNKGILDEAKQTKKGWALGAFPGCEDVFSAWFDVIYRTRETVFHRDISKHRERS